MADPAVTEWRNSWRDQKGLRRTVRVRWLLNPGRPALRNVEIIEQDGQILRVRELSDAEQLHILPVLLVPPLVNVHTHLEFSSLTAPLNPPTPFPAWIQSVIRWRQATERDPDSEICQGLGESRAAGVRVLGEILTRDWPGSYESHAPLSVVLFREAIGLRPQRIQEQLSIAELHLRSMNGPKTVAGLSPHAPYTVHPDLLDSLVSLSCRFSAPVAMHLAETRAELELLEQGRGPFVDFLQQLNLFDSTTFPGGRQIRDELTQLARAPRALVVHGNYLSAEDRRFLATQPQMTVVYCPRTHAWFHHDAYPLEHLRSESIRVVLATDSRASNPDLSVWREFQEVVRRFPQIPPEHVLSMVTDGAAEALGIPETVRSVSEGERFDPIFVRCPMTDCALRTILVDPETQPLEIPANP